MSGLFVKGKGLSVKALSVMLRDQCVIKNANFKVKQGEHACIIGPNGAGKTSLLKALAGDFPPDKHTISSQEAEGIFWCGQNMHHLTPRQRAQTVAVLPQFNPLNFPFSVREVINLGRIPYATSTHVNGFIINTLLDWLALTPLQHKQYVQLSGGEKQRVQLARVLAQAYGNSDTFDGSNKLLLLDEPTSALDLQHQTACALLFKQLQQQGLTIVSVVHDINLASQMANTLIGLKHGHIIVKGTPHKVITPANIQAIFDVDAHVMTHPNNQTPFIVM